MKTVNMVGVAAVLVDLLSFACADTLSWMPAIFWTAAAVLFVVCIINGIVDIRGKEMQVATMRLRGINTLAVPIVAVTVIVIAVI